MAPEVGHRALMAHSSLRCLAKVSKLAFGLRSSSAEPSVLIRLRARTKKTSFWMSSLFGSQ